MKIREMILDFTSLLDVIMIILFFFILFSHFETEEMKQQYAQDYQALEEASEAVEDKSLQLDEQLSFVADMENASANNMEALLEFIKGTNLKAYLKTNSHGWSLEIQKKNEQSQESETLIKLRQDDNISQEIKKLLYQQDYDADDRILLEFVYNGNSPGTDNACEQVLKAFSEVRKEYLHFYCSETDTSILESE